MKSMFQTQVCILFGCVEMVVRLSEMAIIKPYRDGYDWKWNANMHLIACTGYIQHCFYGGIVNRITFIGRIDNIEFFIKILFDAQ